MLSVSNRLRAAGFPSVMLVGPLPNGCDPYRDHLVKQPICQGHAKSRAVQAASNSCVSGRFCQIVLILGIDGQPACTNRYLGVNQSVQRRCRQEQLVGENVGRKLVCGFLSSSVRGPVCRGAKGGDN